MELLKVSKDKGILQVFKKRVQTGGPQKLQFCQETELNCLAMIAQQQPSPASTESGSLTCCQQNQQQCQPPPKCPPKSPAQCSPPTPSGCVLDSRGNCGPSSEGGCCLSHHQHCRRSHRCWYQSSCDSGSGQQPRDSGCGHGSDDCC
ncbi:late cornified envelope protein 3A-like [Pteronotus mesoamericanus]|uniref:late cornified envelope protein 3A-like n=1 Tax=Pteronotus mesoamericanus TaxID=1884717 RepID=UPI0023EB899F|nr:late cornified envelope protein 3A-like [Pteronotus parnellii mesoamericanus]